MMCKTHQKDFGHPILMIYEAPQFSKKTSSKQSLDTADFTFASSGGPPHVLVLYV